MSAHSCASAKPLVGCRRILLLRWRHRGRTAPNDLRRSDRGPSAVRLMTQGRRIHPSTSTFLRKRRYLDVDDVVDRRGAAWLLLDIVREHLAGYHMPLMPRQILQELELASGDIHDLPVRVTRRA
jgi:hypothetical protein